MNEQEKKRVLNAGSGATATAALDPVFAPNEWAEVRLDIDPATKPDLVASIVDMRSVIADSAFHALYTSHAIEHLYEHEVVAAFLEFRRVLKPDGFALVTCPNLTAIARFMLQNSAETVAYVAPAGPIRPLDMFYGHGKSIADGRVFMAHRTGFDPQRLGRIGLAAGFAEVRLIEGSCFDLWALLLGPEASIDQIRPMFAGTRLEGLCVGEVGKQSSPVSPPAEEPASA